MISFVLLVIQSHLVFDVPIKGSLLALSSALSMSSQPPALGLLMSTFTNTQIAALFGTAVLTMLPTVSFSGLTTRCLRWRARAAWIGQFFPATYFLIISRGVFTKALEFADLHAALPRAGRLHAGADRAQRAAAQEAGELRPPDRPPRCVACQHLPPRLKELISLWNDKVLLIMICWAFSGAIYTAATATSQELHNAPIAIVDEDQSPLSSRIVGAFYPPYFRQPEDDRWPRSTPAWTPAPTISR
jgi:ribosome-dependent ATPase